MSLYALTSYKDAIKDTVGMKRSAGLSFQALAEHCRVQKTYLSKVLNREGHLSEDQLYLALAFLGFNAEEQEFILLLHSLERSQLPVRRRELESKVDAIRVIKLKTESNLKLESTKTQSHDLTEYYLDPVFQVVHMCLTLKRFQSEPLTIAPVIGLKAKLLIKYLRGLEKMNLVKLTEAGGGTIARAQILQDNLHLPEDSVLHPAYAARMRLKGMEKMDQLTNDEAYRFSVIFSTNPRVRQKIHASFLEWLKSVQKSVQGSREEDVYQINFDLFNWT